MEERGEHQEVFAVLYREVRVGLAEELTSVQRPEGGEGTRHVDI